MSPALLLVLFALRSVLMIGAALGRILGLLPMPAGLTLVALGSTLEGVAVLLYARQRKSHG
jgi:hypothetical protein